MKDADAIHNILKMILKNAFVNVSYDINLSAFRQ